MYALRPPFFYRMLSPGHLLCSLPAAGNTLYVTFDDGPVPEATPQALSILDHFGVKATFFCVGHNVTRHPDLYRRLLDGGHRTGNHTFHHLNGWTTPPGAYAEDAGRCAEVVDSRLFRPPYGRITPSQFFLLRRTYRIILWSLLSADFDPRISPERCLRNLTENVSPGDIIVFHDSPRASDKVAYALPRFLEYCLDKGWRLDLL